MRQPNSRFQTENNVRRLNAIYGTSLAARSYARRAVSELEVVWVERQRANERAAHVQTCDFRAEKLDLSLARPGYGAAAVFFFVLGGCFTACSTLSATRDIHPPE